MPLLTATISGQILNPGLSASTSRVTIEAATDGGRITYAGVAIMATIPVKVNRDGTASVTLPQVPQAGMSPPDPRWRLRIVGGGETYTTLFTLTADTTWDQIIQTSNIPATSEYLAAIIAAASAVQQGQWAANTAYTSGQTVNAPDGTQIKANSSRTSRPSFDATEQTFWTPVATKAGTLEQTAINAAFIPRGTRGIDVRDAPYAAVGDNVADDSAAIAAAAAAAAAAGVTLYAQGTFKIASTVDLGGCDAELSAATFNYTGTGLAVSIGNSTSGSFTTGKYMNLPDIVFVNKPGTGWTASTIGLRVINLFSSDVHVGRVTGFEDGVLVYGRGMGCVYNTLTLRHLDNNKRNMRFSGDATGWANQNTIVGGRMSHNSGEGAQVAGTRHVVTDSLSNTVNNNVFVGVSLESPNVVEYHIEAYGWDCVWLGCRWENTTLADTRVYWRANSRGNVIMYGANANSIVEVVEAGSTNTLNSIITKYGQRLFGSGTAANTAGLLLENNAASSSPVGRVMEAGAYAASADPTTAYAWEWTAEKLTGKRSTDATSAPRVELNAVNGTVRVMRAATGSRPSASSVGAGSMFLDSTLNKPIWSDGTNWRDATGTIV